MTKNAVITGATGSIGTQLALQLAQQGWNLILINRSVSKTAELLQTLRSQHPTAQIHDYLCDLSSPSELLATAKTIVQQHPQIHALINNAGVLLREQRVATTGHDLHYQINVVAPYLLTEALLPALQAQAAVVNASSGVALSKKALVLQQLSKPPKQGLMGAYTDSKKAVSLLSLEQAQRYQAQGIRVFAIDPGPNQSDMTQNKAPFFIRWLARFLPTPDKGARFLLEPVIDGQLQPVSGCIWSGGKPKALPTKWATPEQQRQLWSMLEQETIAKT